jgi:hypothetical protein
MFEPVASGGKLKNCIVMNSRVATVKLTLKSFVVDVVKNRSVHRITAETRNKLMPIQITMFAKFWNNFVLLTNITKKEFGNAQNKVLLSFFLIVECVKFCDKRKFSSKLT